MFIMFCSAPQQPCQRTPSPRQRQDCGNLTGISSAYFLFWPCNASCFRSSLSAIKAPCHHTSVHFFGWNTTQSTTNWAILNKWSQKNTADQSSGSALVTEDVCHEMRWCYQTSQLPELQSCGSFTIYWQKGSPVAGMQPRSPTATALLFKHGCNKARHCLRCSICPEDQAPQYVHVPASGLQYPLSLPGSHTSL